MTINHSGKTQTEWDTLVIKTRLANKRVDLLLVCKNPSFISRYFYVFLFQNMKIKLKEFPFINLGKFLIFALNPSLRVKNLVYAQNSTNSWRHIVVVHAHGNTVDIRTQCRDARSEVVKSKSKIFITVRQKYHWQDKVWL